MPAKFIYSLNFAMVWLLVMLLPLGCGSDDEPMENDQTINGTPVLISTIPINGGALPSYGTLFMTFSEPPGLVIVNSTLASVAGKTAFWNAGGLPAGETVVLFITWTGGGGGTAALTLTIL